VNERPNDKANDNDKEEKNAPKFDWVTQRSACTLPKIFAALRQGVEEDVKTRNGLRPNLAPYEFSVAEDIDEFKVVLKAKDVQHSVSFKLEEHLISVRSDNDKANAKAGPMLQVTLTFDDKGECKLHANEQERELWQVRRMALEDLMFRHQ
jgi:hypothetical protein